MLDALPAAGFVVVAVLLLLWAGAMLARRLRPSVAD
jgi:hypothetical protein